MDVLNTFGGPKPDKAVVEAELMRLGSEVKTVQQVFANMDLNDSGYIDLTEFRDCCEMLGIPFKSDKHAKAEFDKVDANGNGKIDEKEFVAWWQKDGTLQDKLANKFKFAVDKAGSGSESRGAAFG